jgi:hypothetical protein
MKDSIDAALVQALREPPSAIAYALGARLSARFPDLAVFDTSSSLFDVLAYSSTGRCTAMPHKAIYAQIDHELVTPEEPLATRLTQAWLDVEWEGERLQVVTLSFHAGFQPKVHHCVLARDLGVATRFFTAVSRYNAEVHDEVLVFANGCWNKSHALFRAIRATTLESLILPPGGADRILADFQRFLRARSEYERFGIPYKRGALFLGPPGNGKTHCIKALVRELGIPCLYVQSFKLPYGGTEQRGVATVFERARRSAPCVLVLEDLDSLVGEDALSTFLNELDGFAENAGLVTIASTNHPERLDPAILERPSRFDRKYAFDLPAAAERARYVALWNAKLGEELRLDEEHTARVAARTEGFSFAYLKELFVAAAMRYSDEHERERPFASVVLDEATVLTEQMKTIAVLPESRPEYVKDVDRY